METPVLQKVYFDYMHSWIQMLQQLPQASHSLKNLLEEEWNFTKVITPYIRGGEAQSGKLFWWVPLTQCSQAFSAPFEDETIIFHIRNFTLNWNYSSPVNRFAPTEGSLPPIFRINAPICGVL